MQLLGLSALAFAATSSALVARQAGCCSGITVYGLGEGGKPAGQLSDGQVRIGDDSLPEGSFCFFDGGFKDAEGRGCILTPPTTQFQCDTGASPTDGFSISKNGTISHDGDSTFYACPTGMNGGYNIYAKTLASEPGCEQVWMYSDDCYKPSAAPAPASTTTSTITLDCPTETPTPESCPGELTGSWEFPHLIVHINKADANKAYGNFMNGTASGTISSIFNFDIPQSAAGKECSLEFLFPTQDQLETSAFEYSGEGQFEFAILKEVATKETTYATAPKVAHSFGVQTLKPGSAVDLGSCPDGCPAGKAISFWMSPVGDSHLNYFQDFNPCPIDLYVTVS